MEQKPSQSPSVHPTDVNKNVIIMLKRQPKKRRAKLQALMSYKAVRAIIALSPKPWAHGWTTSILMH